VVSLDADGNAVSNATPANKLVLFAGTGTFSSAGNGGESAGLFRSKDGGATWTEVGNFDGLRITSIVPSSTTAGFALVSTFDAVAGTGDCPTTAAGRMEAPFRKEHPAAEFTFRCPGAETPTDPSL
jgi:hypothetical protein